MDELCAKDPEMWKTIEIEFSTRRVCLALDLEPEVVKALEDGKITIKVASVIAGVTAQRQFLEHLLFIYRAKSYHGRCFRVRSATSN